MEFVFTFLNNDSLLNFLSMTWNLNFLSDVLISLLSSTVKRGCLRSTKSRTLKTTLGDGFRLITSR